MSDDGTHGPDLLLGHNVVADDATAQRVGAVCGGSEREEEPTVDGLVERGRQGHVPYVHTRSTFDTGGVVGKNELTQAAYLSRHGTFAPIAS